MKSILTTKEAARLLDSDAETIRRWCREGYLPSVKIGRQYRISVAALVDWWKEQGGGRLDLTMVAISDDDESQLFQGINENITNPKDNLQTNDVTSDKKADSSATSTNPNPSNSRKIVRK